jgi:hypothetical protein
LQNKTQVGLFLGVLPLVSTLLTPLCTLAKQAPLFLFLFLSLISHQANHNPQSTMTPALSRSGTFCALPEAIERAKKRPTGEFIWSLVMTARAGTRKARSDLPRENYSYTKQEAGPSQQGNGNGYVLAFFS